MKGVKGAIFFSALMLGPLALFARVASPTIVELTRSAEAILLVKVVSVSAGPSLSLIASAEVLEVWKGAKVETISYRASPDFACDMSSATIGKTAVIFLKSDEQSGIMSIAYAGRGQMIVIETEGRAYVSLTGVLLPQELEPYNRLIPRQGGMSLVPLDKLKALVVRLVETKR